MPCYHVPNGADYILSGKGPHIEGKRFFSVALTQALYDNGIFNMTTWPEDLGTPVETADFWPYRITVHNYQAIKTHLPDLKVMLVFARDDHVQSAPDKPHIRQAYDGFHTKGQLWVRLNADNVYFQTLGNNIDESYPENVANEAPNNWMTAASWGYPATYGQLLYSKGGSYAALAEMADRVKVNNWSDDLSSVFFDYEISLTDSSPDSLSLSSRGSFFLSVGTGFGLIFIPQVMTLILDKRKI